jgi:hypothetical protein
MRFFLVAVALLLACGLASAAEIAGVRFEDRLSAGGAALELNGAGLRQRAFFQVYAMGLYLPRKTSSAQEAIDMPGSKRIDIRMLRDVGAEPFTEALVDGLKDNHSPEQLAPLEQGVRTLSEAMARVKEARKGMLVQLVWDGRATVAMADGKPITAPIEGEPFFRALLRIWLGERPVAEDLKQALLGRS